MNTRDLQRFFLRVCTALAMAVAALPAAAQVAPPLGEAGSFAVLGGSAVTNTGSTVLAGNLGVSPGTAVTGFPPGVVVDGTIHVDDAVAQQARTDLTTAYNFLAGQAPDVDLTGVDLGGLVLVPGVYRFAAGAQLTGTLTLDAQGDPNAVFVFQIGSTLTTASAANVSMINGGEGCNVYWQIGSSATLGTASSLPGSMLALTSITLTTNASLSGRALARNGAVTLDTNSIVGCVAACEAITLSPQTLPNPAQGTPYNEAISAEGGVAPYLFTLTSGALPTGLALSDAGLVSGTASAVGAFEFTVTATDSLECTGSNVYAFVVSPAGCPSIAIAPAALPGTIVGVPYSRTLSASGGAGPYVFSLFSGDLPAGLALASDGTLSGTPTASGATQFTVLATDANGCTATRAYTMTTVPGVVQATRIPADSWWTLLLLCVAMTLVARAGLAQRPD